MEELSAEHKKCEQLEKREKKVSRREKKAKDSEDKLQSEKANVELKMKALEEKEKEFLQFFKITKFTSSQMKELSQVCLYFTYGTWISTVY